MLLPRNLLVLATAGAAAAAFGAVLGCGAKPPAPGGGPGKGEKAPPRGSPEAAFVRVRDALRGRDFGAIHDILSKDAKARAEADVERAAGSAAAMGPMAPDSSASIRRSSPGLPAREKYVKVMKGAYETNASLESVFRSGKRETGLAGAEVAGAEADGDRATVTVSLPSGATRAMALVREDGDWKLADPLSLRGEESPGPAREKPGAAREKAGAAKEAPGPPKPAEAKPDAPKGPRKR